MTIEIGSVFLTKLGKTKAIVVDKAIAKIDDREVPIYRFEFPDSVYPNIGIFYTEEQVGRLFYPILEEERQSVPQLEREEQAGGSYPQPPWGAGSLRAIVYVAFQLVDEILHILDDVIEWLEPMSEQWYDGIGTLRYRFCNWCHRYDYCHRCAIRRQSYDRDEMPGGQH